MRQENYACLIIFCIQVIGENGRGRCRRGYERKAEDDSIGIIFSQCAELAASANP